MENDKLAFPSFVFIIVILLAIFGFDLGVFISVILGFIGFGISYFIKERKKK